MESLPHTAPAVPDEQPFKLSFKKPLVAVSSTVVQHIANALHCSPDDVARIVTAAGNEELALQAVRWFAYAQHASGEKHVSIRCIKGDLTERNIALPVTTAKRGIQRILNAAKIINALQAD